MRALVAVVLLLGVLFVIADRVGVAVAEDQVADRIAEQGSLPGPPEVDIAGFPFLTQALSGRYDEVRIALTAADLDQPEGTGADIALRGVEVPLSDVVAGSVRQVPVDRVDGTATLSYALLSAQLGPAGRRRRRRGRRGHRHRARRLSRNDLRCRPVGHRVSEIGAVVLGG